MISRLQRFYRASSPDIWLSLKPDLFWALAESMPVIEARERLEHIADQSAATGNMDDRNRKTHLAELQVRARFETPRVTARPSSSDDLRGFGIAVVDE